MKDIKTFINENLQPKGLDKESISQLAKGDSAFDVMFRYNPQLGHYASLTAVVITRVNAKSFTAESYGTSYSYDKATRTRKGKSDLYGSSEHELYTCKEVADLLSSDRKTIKHGSSDWKVPSLGKSAEELLDAMK